ncbi:DegV family protein [Eubacteriales bacterium OttesenSCG-928-K08]|nr:DegV family protein [Eubacteriales bacterium OttesenSCG-928-K08]
MPYQITTDSCVDLPPAKLEELGIRYAKLHIIINGVSKPEDIRHEAKVAFYQDMRAGKQIATSQVNPNEFIELWTPALDAGEDILHISFLSALSGSYNSACVARNMLLEDYPERTVMVIDSLCASGGQARLVERAVALREQNASLKEAYDEIDRWRGQYCIYITPDSLSHLKRSGRITGAAATVATLLQIKPIIVVGKTGELAVLDKVKGRRSSLKRLVDILSEKVDMLACTVVDICHADCLPDANNLKEMILSRLPNLSVYIRMASASIGAHCGPGAIALIFVGGKNARAAT